MGPDPFTFLHAADLHIDSPLVGLVRYDGAPVDELRQGSRRAFENLVDAAVSRGVAFVVLAGDIFDGDWKDFGSGLWFSSQLRRFSKAGIQVFLIRGNHDAESRVEKKLGLPDGVQEFPSRAPKTFRVTGLDVALHGQSFAEAHVTENLSLGYPDAIPGMLNIGVLHTGLEGYEGHGVYAPCSLEDLVSKGYDYWALGHIHKREVLREDPWIVFPGNIQGRHARETGPKGATLVHVADGRIQCLEELHLDVSRWAHVRVDVGGCTEERDSLEAVGDAIRAQLGGSDGRPLAVRVTLTGSTELDGSFRVDLERLRAEIRARSMHLGGDVWIEKVRLETRPLENVEARDGDGILALARNIAGAELSDEEAQALAAQLHKLESRLPRGARSSLRPTDPASIQGVVGSARRYLAALLAETSVSADGEVQE